MKVSKITLTGIIGALYVVMTLVNPISFGMIQFRISEVIALLPFYDRKYIPGCLLGVAIANFFSSLGIIDVVFGLTIVLIAYFLIDKLKKLSIKLILYSLLCGALVGLELLLVSGLPFTFSFVSISLSMLVVSFVSIPVDRWLLKLVDKNFYEKDRK